MRVLSIAGTAAMFLVVGGILVHGIPPLHHFSERLAAGTGLVAGLGPALVGALVGVVAGGVAVVVVKAVPRLFRKKA
jgi:predicted DNA repair protein MutK